MIRVGDIGFSHRKRGLYSRIVRFFTGYFTHCFVCVDVVFGDAAIIEADLKTQIVSFDKEYVKKSNDEWELWRPIAATEADINHARKLTYDEFAGMTYGFLQIPWFMWQKLCNILRLKPGKNWFPSGVICSELTWFYIVNLNSKYAKAFPFGRDEVNPDMLHDVVKSRPDLFEVLPWQKKL